MNNSMRIKYRPGIPCAAVDKTIFQKWENKVITTVKARALLEKSVGEPVSTEQFLANANWLGYFRGGK